MTNSEKSTVRDIVLIPLLAAIMFLGKVCMSGLPNIEPVTLLIFVYTDFMKKKTLLVIAIYILLEGFLYGFGPWWFSYLYLWPLLFFLAYALQKAPHFLIKTVAAALFGLAFGALCSIPYLFIGGIPAAISYFVAGIPFDLLHCAGNALLVGLLYRPLSMLFRKLPQYTKQ